jgi:hypothetical protein
MAAKRREKAQRHDDYPASFLCLLCLFVAIHYFGCGYAASLSESLSLRPKPQTTDADVFFFNLNFILNCRCSRLLRSLR